MLKDFEKKLVLSQKEILDRAINKWDEIRNKKATKSVALSAPDPDWIGALPVAGHPDIKRAVSTNSLQSAIQDIFDFFVSLNEVPLFLLQVLIEILLSL